MRILPCAGIFQRAGQNKLKTIASALKKADKLILATDPDREGEAISWHVCRVMEEMGALDGKPVERVVFNEITKSAVLGAMDAPRAINCGIGGCVYGTAGVGLSSRLYPVAGIVAETAGGEIGGAGAIGDVETNLRTRSRKLKPSILKNTGQ